jgi:hypothetical protein
MLCKKIAAVLIVNAALTVTVVPLRLPWRRSKASWRAAMP